MKKVLVVLGVAAFIAAIAGISYAGGLGPVQPLGSMKWEVGADYNGVFDKNLEGSGSIKEGTVDESTQGYIKVAMGVGDYCNIYGKLGTANFKQKIDWKSDFGSRSQTIEYDYGLLWGVGANGLHDLGNNMGIGADIQFNMSSNEAGSITGSNVPIFTSVGSLNNYDFQTSLYMTYTVQLGENLKAIPYAGGYYSYFNSAVDKAVQWQDNLYNYTLVDLRGDDEFGLLLGVNILTMKNISLNVEGRFIAETAVTAGLNYRF